MVGRKILATISCVFTQVIYIFFIFYFGLVENLFLLLKFSSNELGLNQFMIFIAEVCTQVRFAWWQGQEEGS